MDCGPASRRRDFSVAEGDLLSSRTHGSRLTVAAVYDRRRCHNCKIFGGHRTPLQCRQYCVDSHCQNSNCVLNLKRRPPMIS